MKEFYKSVSGSYYYDEFPFKYPNGYERVSQAEYNAWCIKMGMPDLVVLVKEK